MGAPLRPCSGLRRGPRLRPAGPCSAPLLGLRRALGGLRPGPPSPPGGGSVGPLWGPLRPPWGPPGSGGPAGPPPAVAPPGRPSARLPAPCGGCRWLVRAPPAASGALPCPAWVLAAGPPLGGLPWWASRLWCRASSPHGGGVGPLAPPPCGRHWWPLLLAPEADADRRRRAANRRAVSMSAMAYSAVTVELS